MNKKNLEPGVILGDKILDSFSVFGTFIYDFPIPKGKEVQLFDLKFSSPLIGASFKSQTNIMAMWMRMGLGGAIYKTIMSKKEMEPFTKVTRCNLQGAKRNFKFFGSSWTRSR